MGAVTHVLSVLEQPANDDASCRIIIDSIYGHCCVHSIQWWALSACRCFVYRCLLMATSNCFIAHTDIRQIITGEYEAEEDEEAQDWSAAEDWNESMPNTVIV